MLANIYNIIFNSLSIPVVLKELFYLLTHSSSSKNCAPGIVRNNKIYHSIIAMVIISFFIGSFLILKSSILILLLMISLSTLPVLGLIPSHWKISSTSSDLLHLIIHFFYKTGILKFLYVVNLFWNYSLTTLGQKFFIVLLHLFLLMHLINIKYILYLKINNIPINNIQYILYAIGLVFVLSKALTSLSFFVIPYIINRMPDTAQLLVDELPTLPEANNDHVRPANLRKLFFFGHHTHHNHHPQGIPTSHFYRNCGIFLGVVGTGLSIYACYNYHLAADAAMEANRLKRIEMAKQYPDLQEVIFKNHPEEFQQFKDNH